jgi:hypothetical protein
VISDSQKIIKNNLKDLCIYILRNVLNRHELWKNGKKKKKRKNKGTTSDSPSGLDIFTHETKSYDEKMDAYLLMRRNREDARRDSKNKTGNIDEITRKANIKQEAEELRAWKREIRKVGRNEFNEEKKRKDEEWKIKRDGRGELKAKRDKEDEKWRNKRKEVKEKMNVVITSLVAILVIIDNYNTK